MGFCRQISHIVLYLNGIYWQHFTSEARAWQSQQQVAETCSHIPPIYVTGLHSCYLIICICWISNTAVLLVFILHLI